jgi:hypothetical protein
MWQRKKRRKQRVSTPEGQHASVVPSLCVSACNGRIVCDEANASGLGAIAVAVATALIHVFTLLASTSAAAQATH